MELAFCVGRVCWRAGAVLLLFAALSLAACSGGGGGSQAVAMPPPPPPPNGLISGSESALVSAVLGASSDSALPAQDVSGGFLLSRVLVTFKSDATIGQVNTAARAIGATRITSSEPGSLLVVLEVPRQTNVAAIQGLAKTMRAQPGIAFAWPGHTAKPSVLPEFTAGTPVSTVGLHHLLSERFPQAWNARQAMPADCLSRSVSVYVLDQFGPPSARPDFFLQMERSSFFADPNGMSSNNAGSAPGHGYDVVSTLAAKFDADTPTGANPFADCLIVHAIEAQDVEYVDAVRRALRAVAADPEPRVILTSSLNFVDNGFCGINGDQPCNAAGVATTLPDFILIALTERAVIAAEWARLVRTLDIGDKVLIAQSAGNVDDLPDGFLAQNYLGFRSAAFSSPASLATHLHELKALLTDSSLWADFTASAEDADVAIQPNPSLDPGNSIAAANLLIVDSGAGGESPADVTQSSFDSLGADVRAVGQEVVLDGQNVSGTSFATPLVAGLAAYLWNLAPALSGQPAAATVDLLKRSSATSANSPTVPVIDAYAAVLQLDDVPGCCGGAKFAPMRLGLVDVDGDGGFTGLDLQKFVDAYGLADPNTPTIPAARDFSRFDLNGDGFTGGIPTTAFDLDVNGLDANGRANINATDETVEGYPLTFNEAALSDLQILCYYAYSLLYALDDGGQNDRLRTSLLGADRCVRARINLALPAQISSSTTLNVTVEVPAAQGQFAPAPNMRVDFTPTCATVNPSSGRTNASGSISTVLTPAPGCTSASLQAVARADVNTPALALQVASTTITDPTRSTFAAVEIDQSAGPGVLRATFSDFNADSQLAPIVQFTAPVSDVANFMSRFNDTFAGITEIGALRISLVDQGLPIRVDLPGIVVGDVGIGSSCGSTVSVTVGDARPNAGGSQFTQGGVVVAGCGTVTVRAGKLVAVTVSGANSLHATVSADRVTSGVDIGRGLAVVSSTLELTIGATGTFSITNTSDSTLSIQGSASADLDLIGNRNLTLASTLDSGGLSRDLIVRANSFIGPSLSRLRLGSMRNLTITNNFGFSDTDAHNFADAHTISGTTTISNNQAQ